MRARDFIKDDTQERDTWQGGPQDANWEQQIGIDGGQGYQRAQGTLPGNTQLSVAADTGGPGTTYMPQKNLSISKGPVSLSLGDRGRIAGSYNIPMGQDSSISLSAGGQKGRGVQDYSASYQKGNWSAGVSQSNYPGAKPQINVGYSAQFEDSDLIESRSGQIAQHYTEVLNRKFEPAGIPLLITGHFVDQMSNPRNDPEPITVMDIVDFFSKLYLKRRDFLAKLPVETGFIVADLESGVEVAFSKDSNGLIIANTVIRDEMKRGSQQKVAI
jgi:hypothetical protein